MENQVIDGIIEGVARRNNIQLDRAAQIVARETGAELLAKFAKEQVIDTEIKYQTRRISFDITTNNLNGNLVTEEEVIMDNAYDIVTGFAIVMVTPDPPPAQIPAGEQFVPAIGLAADSFIIMEPTPRQLLMVDINGTTPVNDRFVRTWAEIKGAGNKLKVQTKFLTNGAIAVNALAGLFFEYSITFRLARLKRKIR